MEAKQELVIFDVEPEGRTEKWMQQLPDRVCKIYREIAERRTQNDAFALIQENFQKNKVYLHEYFPTIHTVFDDILVPESLGEFQVKRINIIGKYRGVTIEFKKLVEKLISDVEEQARLLSDRDRELFEDILANTLSKKIRAKIQSSKRWVESMNQLMESMQTSSGLKLSLKWKSKKALKEEQLDTRKLVDILQKDYDIMRPEEITQLSQHFRSKIDEARKTAGESDGVQSFHSIMKEVLDYRKWFEFQLEYQKTGEKKKELTDRTFFTFSGGEKAMAMYVPLFSAVAAKYEGARSDAPRMIYFKKHPIFHKIFTGFQKKYESLGHLGGTVVLHHLTKDEKLQLSGFFQKDFYENKTVTISMNRMEKALKSSKFELLDWMDILESYFGQKIIWKQEVLQRENEKQKVFFNKILKEIKFDIVKECFIIESKKN